VRSTLAHGVIERLAEVGAVLRVSERCRACRLLCHTQLALESRREALALEAASGFVLAK
jgi:hypothetical protein